MLLMLLLMGCVPPWHGEEDNFPIMAMSFYDTLAHQEIGWADAGVTGLEELEHHRALPIGNAMAQPNMNFDSRIDEKMVLLLPLDKGAPISTFVLHATVGTDTVAVRPNLTVGLNRRNRWDANGWYAEVTHHTFASVEYLYDDEGVSWKYTHYEHPKILVWIRVVL